MVAHAIEAPASSATPIAMPMRIRLRARDLMASPFATGGGAARQVRCGRAVVCSLLHCDREAVTLENGVTRKVDDAPDCVEAHAVDERGAEAELEMQRAGTTVRRGQSRVPGQRPCTLAVPSMLKVSGPTTSCAVGETSTIPPPVPPPTGLSWLSVPGSAWATAATAPLAAISAASSLIERVVWSFRIMLSPFEVPWYVS